MNDKIFAILDRSLTNIGQSFLDSYIEANAAFRFNSGMKTIIVRRQLGKCCDWCASLAGVYDYSDAPSDIYKRHDNCRCMVTFRNEKGNYVDVWSRQEARTQRLARKNKLIEMQRVANNTDERAKLKRLAIGAGKQYIDTTEYWRKNKVSGGSVQERDFARIEGVDYKVNGSTVLLDYKKSEWNIAVLLQKFFGGIVEMIPRVTKPKHIKTPDYVLNGQKFDLKAPTGNTKNTIYNNLKESKGQASNVVLDITRCGLSEEECLEYVKDAYRSKHLRHLEMVVVVNNGQIIKIFERI